MKKFNTVAVMSLGLALIIRTGAFASGQKDSSTMAKPADTMAKPADTMMASDSTMEKPVFDLSGLGPQVVPFTDEASAQKLAAKGTVVYFFAASWCPTCRGTYRDLLANYKMIPSNVFLVVVNYDTAKSLEAKYGVTYQHTFVRIDSAGKALKMWSGSPGVEDIVMNAKAM